MEDTIAAIATPGGEAGLAVLRISGQKAFKTVDKCFNPIGKSSCKPSNAASHTIQYGHVVHGRHGHIGSCGKPHYLVCMMICQWG